MRPNCGSRNIAAEIYPILRDHKREVSMSCNRIVLRLSRLVLVAMLCIGGHAAWAQVAQEAQGPTQQVVPEPPPPSSPAVDPVESLDQRLSAIEEWKAKIERLPSLSGKFNVGLNALQFLYTH